MKTLSAWGAYTGSVSKWLKGLIDEGQIALSDTIWSGPDGSMGAGEPTLAEMDSSSIMEMTDSGTVGEWLAGEDNNGR